MDEVEGGKSASATASPTAVGDELKAAREAQGLSLADVAARTRVPLRHLQAIEAGDYAALPSPTYAVGFARSYARAVGADEVAIAAQVRAGIDRMGTRQPEYVPYEAPDPARVPSRGVAIAALGLALAVLILAGLYYGTTVFRGSSGAGQVVPETTTIIAPAPTPTASQTATAPTGGKVSFVANDDVWLRVYDADNKTLYLGTLKPGEHYDVPADARGPMINVGRPDKLAVTLDGRAVPPLGTGERAIKDVKVDGASIAARLAGQPASMATPDATPSSSGSTSPRRDRGATIRSRPRAQATTAVSETQRANLDAAANPPPAAGNSTQP